MTSHGQKNKLRSESAKSKWTNAEALFRKEKRIVKSKTDALFIIACLFIVFLLPLYTSRYVIYIGTLVLINIIAVLGLNLLGSTGQVSIGHGAFMAIGAYITAILCHTYHVSFWIAFLVATGITGIIGVFIAFPALRLKEMYLAMVTFSFNLILYLIIAGLKITGGFLGLNVPKPRIGSIILNTEWQLYYLTLLAVFLFLFFTINLSRTRIQRAFTAIRVREISAQAMGISLWGYKTLAFLLASIYAGASGSLLAVTLGHITPNNFTVIISIEFIMMLLVGGPGSIVGVILGTMLITMLPFFLMFLTQALSSYFPILIVQFANLKIMIYGVILIVFLIYFPGGFQGMLMKFSGYFQRRP